MLFFGESEHSLDNKGRVIIPARLRPALSEGLFVTRGLENCLWLFTMETWKEISGRLADVRMTNSHARQLERLLYSGTEAKLDKQGRLLLPSSLRNFAGLSENGSAVVVGVRNRIELWNSDRWVQLTSELGEADSGLGDSLAELGI